MKQQEETMTTLYYDSLETDELIGRALTTEEYDNISQRELQTALSVIHRPG